MGAFDDIIAAQKQPISTQGHHLGTYTVNGPGQVTAQPPDPYAGVEMKPARTTLDRAQDFILGLMGKGGDLTAAANPSMFTGFVASPRNAQMIKETLQRMMTERPDMTDMDLAINYMRLKYPKIAKLASGWNALPEFETRTVLNPEGGLPIDEYRPNPIRGSYSFANKSVSMTPQGEYYPTEGYVQTAGHELTHALQDFKDPISLRTSYIPEQFNHDMYMNQPWEKQARQGGATAMETFEKFQDLMTPSWQRNQTPDWSAVPRAPAFRDVVLDSPPPNVPSSMTMNQPPGLLDQAKQFIGNLFGSK